MRDRRHRSAIFATVPPTGPPAGLRRLIPGVLSCMLWASAPIAADPPPEAQTPETQTPEAQTPETESLREEITVTAHKRETPLEEAPKAVSVAIGEELEQANIVKLDEVGPRIPGLMVTKNDGAGRVVSIRGVGWETAQNLSTQPSVLIYLDGLYLANPLALGLHLGEIEQIEVHRGPQGTEFGQGTTGGAINVVTKRPEFGAGGGSVELGLGTYDLTELSASGNAPLGEHVAVRASARRYRRDGFAEIEGGALDGYELDDADTLSGHLSAEWIPSADLAVRLGGFFHHSDQNGAAQRSLLDPNPDPRRLTQDYPSRFALDNRSLSAIVDWELGGNLRVRSLTGLQSLEKRQSVDGDRSTEELVSVDLTGFGPANFDLLPFWDNESEVTSQELNLIGSARRLDWLLGLYYLDHENRNFFLEAIGPAPASQFEEALANPSPETLPPFQPPLEFVEDRTVTRQDEALFGHAVVDLSDRLSVTFGGRLQRDRSTDRTTQFWFVESRRTLEETAFTWRLGADLRLGERHLLYGSVATGWKNGGVNPGALDGAALDVPSVFRPEEVTAFELGARSRVGAAHLATNLFFYDYRDYQYIQEDPVPFSAGTGNIPRVQIYGLEAELGWQLSERLRLDGHLAASDGEIVSQVRTLDVADFLVSGFGRFTETAVEDRASLRVDLAGNEPPKLPDLTARLLLTHRRTVAGRGELTSSFEYAYRGEYQYRVFNNPRVDRVPAWATVGLAFEYEPTGSPFSFALRGSNLLDEDGVNSRFTNPFGLHTTSDELIPPRQVVGTVRYRF